MYVGVNLPFCAIIMKLFFQISYKAKFELNKVMNLKSHWKKIIAPIVVSLIMILYYVIYFGVLVTLLDGIWKYAIGIISIVFSVVMVKVCIERINEIRKGEEDDISKY